MFQVYDMGFILQSCSCIVQVLPLKVYGLRYGLTARVKLWVEGSGLGLRGSEVRVKGQELFWIRILIIMN
jgi:hypothetical protein